MGTTTTLTPGVDLRRSADRMHTMIGWLDSRHSFSFGRYYDPANTHFGLLMVSNDDIVTAGSGFETHPHRDMEIVTWVLEGSLVHQDSTGHSGLIHPGLAQRMSAGSGILHSEKNDSWRLAARSAVTDIDAADIDAADVAAADIDATDIDATDIDAADIDAAEDDRDVHFVQMWVVPDTEGGTPGYEQRDIGSTLDSGELVVVASGMPKHAYDRAISIRQGNAALYAARLGSGGATALPVAPLVHLFVARGSVDLEGAGTLGTGDTARVTVGDGQRVVAGPDGAEVLVWEMHATLR